MSTRPAPAVDRHGNIITADIVAASLDRAVAAKGADYVYDRHPGEGKSECLYVHDRGTPQEAPGCIVGWVYHDLTGKLVNACHEDKGAAFLATSFGWPHDVVGALGAAQMAQDGGKTWGEAVREFHRELYLYQLDEAGR